MALILVGTASWTDSSLIKSGQFYPRDCKSPEDRLRFYAANFEIVEVDSSYYALPSAANAVKWAERTPENFVFNVKAYRALTGHQTPKASFPKDLLAALGDVAASTKKTNLYYKDLPPEIRDELWKRFIAGIQPLQAAGKLGALHFQFAPWVTYGPKAMAHIEDCAARLPGMTLAVEFRHRSWFEPQNRQATLEFETARKLVNVTVDEPQGFENCIPAVWDVTNPELAILRLHGRNHGTWNDKSAQASSDRFNYEYSDEELDELAEAIAALVRNGVKNIHVIFNNNYGNQGQKNAAQLVAKLSLRLPRQRKENIGE